jgi:hypothetical protein
VREKKDGEQVETLAVGSIISLIPVLVSGDIFEYLVIVVVR